MQFKTLILAVVMALTLGACTHTANQAANQDGTTQSETVVVETDGTAAGGTMPEGEQSANNEDESMVGGDAVVGNDKMTEGKSMMVEDGDEITLEASNYKFDVTKITAKPGDSISLTLNVVDGFHDLVIDELDVATEQMQVGGSETVTIKIPADAEPGTEYEYYCSVGQHRQMGMVGTLVVE